VIGEGRPATSDGEAIAGYGLLASRGWALADTIDVTIGDTTETITIVGWYRETEDSGEILQVRSSTLEHAVDPGDYRAEINLTLDADPDSTAGSLSDTLKHMATAAGRTPPQVRTTTSGEQSAPLTAALVVLAMLVGAVVAAHVLASAITTARERVHRTATLRSLGLTPHQLLLESACHGAVIGLTGSCLGVPLGLLVQQVIGDAITTSIGAGPGLAVGPSGTQTLTAALIATCATISLSCLAARSSATKPIPALLGSSD
jgi:putative ABC transport system permease protein